MKKLFLALALIAATGVAFVSCDNKNSCCQQNEASPIDTTPEQAELIDVVSTKTDTTANGVVNVENKVQVTPVEVQQ